AVHQLDGRVAVQLQQPERERREPVVVVAVQHDRRLGVTPASDSSFANAFLSGMSRRTGSLSCDCQFQPTAPARCPESYAVVSTSTSIRRTAGSARCPTTQSVETSTSGCA